MKPSEPGFSIRRLLVGWQIGILLLLAVAASGLAYSLMLRSFNALRELELTQIANAIARHGIDDDSDDASSSNKEDPGDFLSQVWEADGSLAYASHSPPVPKPNKMGNYDFQYGGRVWHGHAQNNDGLIILVAREQGARFWLLRDISLPLLIILALLTVFLSLMSWRLIGYALSPLSALRRELLQRDALSLEPLPTQTLPPELTPLVDTLNHLLARIDNLLGAQREFVADAAHELRTPIAAVRLYAQLAERSNNKTERQAAIQNVQESAIRATRLVEQLLALARLEPENTQAMEPVALAALAREVVANHSAQADAKEIDLGITEAASGQTPGNSDELRMLLNNLVDNAVRYTPSGGRIDVSVLATAAGIELRVEDTGPGIPEALHKKVFERFHRAAGADQPGSGLGLAIVKRIAERHAATIHLANRAAGGLQVRIVFPL
ncbi:MAG: ATP-binding protein [Betaproteobacteria bacterium]|nr:ATP-binding protein [Betaproteobacteria bacterium]